MHHRHSNDSTSFLWAFLMAFIVCLGFQGVARADAPQFIVENAHYVFNPYEVNNGRYGSWVCDSQTDTSHGPGCYGDYPASVTGGGVFRVAQDTSTNDIRFYTVSGTRDGGFLDPQFYDTLISWEAIGAQGTDHKLREVRFEQDSTLYPGANTSEINFFVMNKVFFDPDLDRYIATMGVFDTGKFPSGEVSAVGIGQSVNGLDTFLWDELFRIVRPNGPDSGGNWHVNKASLIHDPTTPFRWIGVMYAKQHDANSQLVRSALTPYYVDYDRKVFGLLFEGDGWCEYPWGTVFTAFDTSAGCSAPNTIPGNFAGRPGSDFVNGFKQLFWFNNQLLMLTSDREQNQIPYQAGNATCPPESFGYDHGLYETRSRMPPFDFSRFYKVIEVNLSTWGALSQNINFNGSFKRIQDSAGSPSSLKIDPTDSSVIGNYAAEAFQYNSGTVYLYLQVKRTLCEVNSGGLDGWDRFPKEGSGAGVAWFRLTTQ